MGTNQAKQQRIAKLTGAERYEMMQTKVSPIVYARIRRIAKLKGITDYQLIQMMVDCIVRYMDDRHNLSDELEKAMSIFEHLEGWRDALNHADPSVHRIIGEAIYFLFDEEGHRHGCRAVHVMKPFFGNWTEDVNIQHIIERCFALIVPQRYRRLKALCKELDCSSIVELMDYFIDHFESETDREELRKYFEDANRAENNRPLEYGKRTKRKRHVSPDEATLNFEN